MPQNSRRFKTSVEIYFLLYLSAIILLLGTTPGSDPDMELEEAIKDVLAFDFRLKVEKPSLEWRFVPAGMLIDSADRVNLRRDSMNVITAYGSVSDIVPTIVAIEDTLSGEVLPSSSARRR